MMTGRSRSARRHCQSGQAMVEFMLVVVFLFMLLASIIQLILLMNAYSTLTNAAKEGVRYAIVHGTGNDSTFGGNGCSGPGTADVQCSSDTDGNTYVRPWVLNFASLTFQSIPASEVTVDYNPNSVNGNTGYGGAAGCSKAGCMVQVRISHQYSPFFGLPWPTVTLNAIANGIIVN